MYLNSTKDILLSQFWTFSEYFFSAGRFSKLAGNGSRLGEGGELEVQMFMLVQKLIRIPNVQI